jgi:hypothetical protein
MNTFPRSFLVSSGQRSISDFYGVPKGRLSFRARNSVVEFLAPSRIKNRRKG